MKDETRIIKETYYWAPAPKFILHNHNLHCLLFHYDDLCWCGIGNSSQIGPDFWAKGWDWGNLSSHDPLIRQAMFLLSSGIFEWEVLTETGWQFINIGEWIKAQGIEINEFFGLFGFGQVLLSFLSQNRVSNFRKFAFIISGKFLIKIVIKH